MTLKEKETTWKGTYWNTTTDRAVDLHPPNKNQRPKEKLKTSLGDNREREIRPVPRGEKERGGPLSSTGINAAGGN